MSLDRSLALLILLISLIYGYTAYFVMDAAMLPFAKMSAIWPSSFPKIIAGAGILVGLLLVVNQNASPKKSEIDLQHIQQYQWRPALALLVMMIAYALLLRPLGFIITTFCFLVFGSMVLGEKKKPLLVVVSILCAFGIWYLVQQVLGIYLRPWPWFIAGGF